MQYTEEQLAPISSKSEITVVKSAAGSGKTTILAGFAKANPKRRMLYLCYNKSIQEEAKTRFPGNVVCRTGHAIAFHYAGKALAHKLGNLRLTDVKRFLGTPNWDLAADSISVFEGFLASADRKFKMDHVVPEKLRSFSAGNPKYQQKLIINAQKIWDATRDPNHKLTATHDVYLKIYCLSEPNLNQYFSDILFDEAQDANPVIMDLIRRQKTNKFVVGDDHQQLYRWRGASNSLSTFSSMPNASTYYMTQSFRFGPEVAKLASAMLKFKKLNVDCDIFEVKGLDSIRDSVHQKLPTKYKRDCYTVLHRTVASTIETAARHADKHVHWIGGIVRYNLDSIEDVYYLSTYENKKIKQKKLLVDFPTFDDYKAVAKATADSEMNRTIKLIDEFKSALPSIFRKLRSQECKDIEHADIVVSTAHRSKGLEFPCVQLADDFNDLCGDEAKDFTPEEIADEVNLLYVAITRASLALGINESVSQILLTHFPDIMPLTAQQIEMKERDKNRRVNKKGADGNTPSLKPSISRPSKPSRKFTQSIPLSKD